MLSNGSYYDLLILLHTHDAWKSIYPDHQALVVEAGEALDVSFCIFA